MTDEELRKLNEAQGYFEGQPLTKSAEPPFEVPEPVCTFVVNYWRGKERIPNPFAAEGAPRYAGLIYCTAIPVDDPGFPMPETMMGFQTLDWAIYSHSFKTGPYVGVRAMHLAKEHPHDPVRENNGKRIYWHGTVECETCKGFHEQAEQEFGWKLINGEVLEFVDGEWVTHAG